MAKNEIALYVDGTKVYARSSSREYAWALVGVGQPGSSSEVQLCVLSCSNSLAAIQRQRALRSGATIVRQIRDREIRVSQADIDAIDAAGQIAEHHAESDRKWIEHGEQVYGREACEQAAQMSGEGASIDQIQAALGFEYSLQAAHAVKAGKAMRRDAMRSTANPR